MHNIMKNGHKFLYKKNYYDSFDRKFSLKHVNDYHFEEKAKTWMVHCSLLFSLRVPELKICPLNCHHHILFGVHFPPLTRYLQLLLWDFKQC
jgi:hypothetical protein